VFACDLFRQLGDPAVEASSLIAAVIDYSATALKISVDHSDLFSRF
jgi:hypothetical protein